MEKLDRNILIVDHDPAVRSQYSSILKRDYCVYEAATGKAALRFIDSHLPDIILLEVDLQGIDGLTICSRVRQHPNCQSTQVIVVSSKPNAKEQTRAYHVGADDYLAKPISPDDLLARVELHFRLLDSRAETQLLQQKIETNSSEWRRRAEAQTKEILEIQDVAVFTLAKVAESRDNETGEHIVRLREYAQRIAIELQNDSPYSSMIHEGFLADLYRSSPLHDIGKVGVPDAILLKPASLTKDEFEIMKTHTLIGGNILNDAVMQLSGAGFLSMAAAIAQFHHERWDGTGYPAGLVGDEIPLPARIVAVADVFDALTSERPYKEAWSTDQARKTIDERAGTQFDEVVIHAFHRCFDEILELQQEHLDQQPVAVGAMAFAEYQTANDI